MHARLFYSSRFALALTVGLALALFGSGACAQDAAPPEASLLPAPPEVPAAGEAVQPPAEAPVAPDAPVADGAFDKLIAVARERVAAPYVNDDTPLPPDLAALGYDGHRDIRCLPENFLWYGTTDPFRVQFRHRGWLFEEEVDLSTVSARGDDVTPLPFSENRFTYGPIARAALDPAELPRDLGYAGLSLHRVAWETVDGKAQEAFNEFMSIQGGCYFRGIGDGQHWGASARAVAINTAIAGSPEEFPRWDQLWVRQALPGDTRITLYGLYDGPSVVGAVRMVIQPGPTLAVDIDHRMFFRTSVEKLGIAPITSMFLFGEADPAQFNDYRPEVHDSDNLVMANDDGTVTVRPLRNPRHHLAVSRFWMAQPKGFGLVQRDRAFDNYQDLETEMNIRPSIWVTPKAGFGNGWVELLEIASDDEGVDNIGAYWIIAGGDGQPLTTSPGSELSLSYRVDFTQEPRPTNSGLIRWTEKRLVVADENVEQGSVVRAADDRQGPAGSRLLRVLIDCEPQSALPNGTIVRADVQATRGELVGKPIVQYNRFTHAYRLFFDVRAFGPEPLELRAVLRGSEGQPLTETWVYRWDVPTP